MIFRIAGHKDLDISFKHRRFLDDELQIKNMTGHVIRIVTFTRVAEKHSFTAAASKLGVPRPGPCGIRSPSEPMAGDVAQILERMTEAPEFVIAT